MSGKPCLQHWHGVLAIMLYCRGSAHCPCKWRIIHCDVELCAPYRGKFAENKKRRGKPLRYNLSSLRDYPIAKFIGHQYICFSLPFPKGTLCAPTAPHIPRNRRRAPPLPRSGGRSRSRGNSCICPLSGRRRARLRVCSRC